ncbi:MAG: DUF1850 domain-containing protein [Pseudomonadota bacterium]|nr:DUF1850 domain-containing protein [Pseudomonadota bacterium]
MSGLCIFEAGKSTMLAVSAFTLSWTHSVEKTEWRERWIIKDHGMVIAEARVRGSGAGMDPGPGARLEDGWWIWHPTSPPVSSLALANSGATQSHWTLCAGDRCLEIGTEAEEPTLLKACP